MQIQTVELDAGDVCLPQWRRETLSTANLSESLKTISPRRQWRKLHSARRIDFVQSGVVSGKRALVSFEEGAQ